MSFKTGSVLESLLGRAKWATYHLLCFGDYRRYMRLRAAAVRQLARRGWYERDNIRYLRGLVRAGDTVVDVGANLGAYSICLAAAVGSAGKVLAFEPLSETFEWLKQNTAALPQVQCVNTALSDQSAPSLQIQVPLLFGCIPEASLAGFDTATAMMQPRTVRVERLDDYLAELERLSFIKVDVEGHEMAFLEGCRQTLARFPAVVQFECNDIASRFGQLAAFTREVGYSLCTLEPGRGLDRLETPSTAKGNNFYLVPNRA